MLKSPILRDHQPILVPESKAVGKHVIITLLLEQFLAVFDRKTKEEDKVRAG